MKLLMELLMELVINKIKDVNLLKKSKSALKLFR